MIGHMNDRTLDSLLDGSLNISEEQAIEAHARQCDGCLRRLREWEILFPDLKRLIPTGEHPIFAPGTPSPRPPSLDVYVPDWSPPPRRPASSKIAWTLVSVLGLSAAFLGIRGILDKHDNDTGFYQSEQAPPPAATPRTDSAGLGSGMSASSAGVTQPVGTSGQPDAKTDTVPTSPPATTGPVATRTPAPPPPAPVTTPAEQDNRPALSNREPPVEFPIRVSQNPQRASASPSTGSTTTGAPGGTTPASAPAPALPAQFSRVTLGDAMNRLAGSVRLIQGLTPEAVEVAPGTLLPGAAPDRVIVRIIYNLPDGRIILDQQRLDHPGGGEPSIAISTTSGGVSIAQWVDRGGFWISLAGRTDQQSLLAMANRIQ
jgi:hypothetical protein